MSGKSVRDGAEKFGTAESSLLSGFYIFLPLMISRVSHCGMHVQSAQTKINNFISFFRNIKLTLVVTNKKCDSHKVMYYRIYIIAMTAKFTGLV